MPFPVSVSILKLMDFQRDRIFFLTLAAGFFRDDLISVKLASLLAILDYIAT